MRLIVLLLLTTFTLVSRAVAQEHVNTLPEIVIGNDKSKGTDKNAAPPEPILPDKKNSGDGAGAPKVGGAEGGAGNGAGGSGNCTGKQSDPTQAMNCLNQQLKGQVDRVNPTVNTPPLDAKSGDTKVGVVNIPGVKQQYGKNFGISAVPFRPAPPVFTRPGNMNPGAVVPFRPAVPAFTPPNMNLGAVHR